MQLDVQLDGRPIFLEGIERLRLRLRLKPAADRVSIPERATCARGQLAREGNLRARASFIRALLANSLVGAEKMGHANRPVKHRLETGE